MEYSNALKTYHISDLPEAEQERLYKVVALAIERVRKDKAYNDVISGRNHMNTFDRKRQMERLKPSQGSSMSLFTKDTLLAKDEDIIVIDPEHEYSAIVDILKGVDEQ